MYVVIDIIFANFSASNPLLYECDKGSSSKMLNFFETICYELSSLVNPVECEINSKKNTILWWRLSLPHSIQLTVNWTLIHCLWIFFIFFFRKCLNVEYICESLRSIFFHWRLFKWELCESQFLDHKILNDCMMHDFWELFLVYLKTMLRCDSQNAVELILGECIICVKLRIILIRWRMSVR